MSDSIADRSQTIVDEFALFDDWMGRYEYLIEMGRSIPQIEERYKNDTYRIRGCQSQVWLHAVPSNGSLTFTGDSDAMITKGLVALLIRVLDGQPAQDIANFDFDFLDEIGMKEHLSSTRRNGLNAMIEKIRSLATDVSQGSDVTSVDVAHENGVQPPTEEKDERKAVIEDQIINALKQVYDPEIPVNVYDLGLIYETRVNPDDTVHIVMTLTTPNCPAAGILPGQVETAVGNLPDVKDVRVELTFDPPYSPDMMSEVARLELGWL